MKVFVALALLAVVGTAYAVIDYQDYYSYPKYHYSYGVEDKHTGDKKSAGETRDGEYTKGYYQLLQPDGVTRLVKYVVHPKEGFQAEVINKGKASHPHNYGYHHRQGYHGGYSGSYSGGYGGGLSSEAGIGRGSGGF